MAQHVVTAAGPPTAAPPSIGAHYIDSDNGDIYLGNGTTNAEDWLLGGGGAFTGGTLYKIEAQEGGGNSVILFSLDGGISWKAVEGSPDDVGVETIGNNGTIQAYGDILFVGLEL